MWIINYKRNDIAMESIYCEDKDAAEEVCCALETWGCTCITMCKEVQ